MMAKQKITHLILDVDGTLTDGKVYMGNDGEMIKAFSIKDGCGIKDILIPYGITPVIVTGRTSQILVNRCNEIGITEVYQGVGDKIAKLKEVCRRKENNQINVPENVHKDRCINLENVAYMGDDINDFCAMKLVRDNGGIVGCPADASKMVKGIADFVSKRNGGNGAVRDFIEWLVGEDNLLGIYRQ